MKKKVERNTISLGLVMLAGVVVGGFLGEYIGSYENFEWLKFGYEIGIGGETPMEIDLMILKVQIGVVLKFTIAGVIGLGLAAFLYNKV